MANLRTIVCPAALAAAALLALPAAAEGPDLATVEVTARPTTVTISLVDKAATQVYGEINQASRTVCRNAVGNSELDLGDYTWCQRDSQHKARQTYAKLVKTGALAAGPAFITLSAR